MNQRLYLGTNTKMYKGIAETVDYLERLAQNTADLQAEPMELFVLPSFTALAAASASSHGRIRLGAQNLCWEGEGQFTGEISPCMLQETGAEIAMIGHSERRHIFGETDEMENRKVLCALRYQLTPLLCVGETNEEKNSGQANAVLDRQLELALQGVSSSDALRLRIAYEPVWAIGVNGMPADKAYAAEKHGVIRQKLADLFGKTVSEQIPILYGGSVNPDNSPLLIQEDNIDGLFIGRSAWEANRFNDIIRTVLNAWKKKRERL